MTLRGVTVLAAYLMAGLAASAWAGELAGVTLAEQTIIEESTLVLNGMGLREATWFKINVYVAGLHLEAKSTDADAILRPEIPKRIVFVFVRSVGRTGLIREWDETCKTNVGEDFAALGDRIATLHAWIPDAVRQGDKMTLTYLPGKRCRCGDQGRVQGDDSRRRFRPRPVRHLAGRATAEPDPQGGPPRAGLRGDCIVLGNTFDMRLNSQPTSAWTPPPRNWGGSHAGDEPEDARARPGLHASPSGILAGRFRRGLILGLPTPCQDSKRTLPG